VLVAGRSSGEERPAAVHVVRETARGEQDAAPGSDGDLAVRPAQYGTGDRAVLGE
jgi:hypothetical protein